MVDVSVDTGDNLSAQARSSMVNMGTNVSNQNLGENCRTGMAMIPIKVRARESDKSIITNTFLDNGSNSSFCSESLMKQLGVCGKQVKISPYTCWEPFCNQLVQNFAIHKTAEDCHYICMWYKD